MKPTIKAGLLLALLSCLIFTPAAKAQAQKLGLNVPPPAVPLLEPRQVRAGTILDSDGVFFTPAAYNALRADYHWQGEAVDLKNQRLDQAASIEASTTQLLLQSQLETNQAREQLHTVALLNEGLQTQLLTAQAQRRPFLLLDRRLYLGGGIGLGLGVLGTTYLLWRLR